MALAILTASEPHVFLDKLQPTVFWHSDRLIQRNFKSECVDIFHESFLWLLRHTDEPQKGRNSCLWLQSRSDLSSFGVVLMFCRVNFYVVRSALQYSACRI